MNAPKAATHPTREVLKEFGLGKLDSASSDTMLQHLERCEDCRRIVAETSGDSFLKRLRTVQKADGTPVPDKSVFGVAGSSNFPASAPNSSTIGSVPPELMNNPEYQSIEELGRGGMGVVYKARNTMMDRDEVLKVMSKEIMARPGAAERFKREIQSAAKLSHPNVVQAYSARMLGDLLVFTMEFIPGTDLGMLVKHRGPLPIANACYYVQQVANGLQHAHEKGMVHRDIKPANLTLSVEGKKHVVKILDFGLAKATSENQVDGGLTGEGRMMGTPDYMAPEQAMDAARADIRADIYSLGCTLYFLISGDPPFGGNSLLQLLQAHQTSEAKRLNLVRPEVPVELAAVVSKMMAKDPAKRYQTPSEVAKALGLFVTKSGVVQGIAQRDLSCDTAQRVIAKSTVASAQGVTSVPKSPSGSDTADQHTELTGPDHSTERPRPASTRVTRRKPSSRRREAAPARPMSWKWSAVASGAVIVLLISLWACSLLNSKVKTQESQTNVVEDLPDSQPAKPQVGPQDNAKSAKTENKQPLAQPNESPPSEPVVPIPSSASSETPTRTVCDIRGRVQALGDGIHMLGFDDWKGFFFGSQEWTDQVVSFELRRLDYNSNLIFETRSRGWRSGYQVKFLPGRVELVYKTDHGKAAQVATWFDKSTDFLDWTPVSVSIQGSRVIVSVHDREVINQECPGNSSGRIGFASFGEAAVRNLRMTAPDGRILVDRLPALPQDAPPDPLEEYEPEWLRGGVTARNTMSGELEKCGWVPVGPCAPDTTDAVAFVVNAGGELATQRTDYRDLVHRVTLLLTSETEMVVELRATNTAGKPHALTIPIATVGASLSIEAPTFDLDKTISHPLLVSSDKVQTNNWFSLETRVVEDSMSVIVNGVCVGRFRFPAGLTSSGQVRIRVNRGSVKVRRLQLVVLPFHPTNPEKVSFANQRPSVNDMKVSDYQVIFGVSPDKLKKWMDNNTSKGFKLIYLDTHQDSLTTSHSAIAVRDHTKHLIEYIHMTPPSDWAKTWQNWNQKKYRLVLVSTGRMAGEEGMISYWRKDDAGPWWSSTTFANGVVFNAELQKYAGGARPQHSQRILDDRTRNQMQTVRQTPPHNWKVHFDITQEQLAHLLEMWKEIGWRPDLLYAYNVAGQTRFTVVAEQRGAKPETWDLKLDLTPARVDREIQEHSDRGLRPAAITSYGPINSQLYAITWVPYNKQ